MIYISPAERDPILLELGKVSSIPERVGADFLWVALGKKVGLQRKTHADFRASLHDGRLQKEIMQFNSVDVPILILEGVERWTPDGYLYDNYERFTKKQLWGLLMSIQLRGVSVIQTDSVCDTAEAIRALHAWTQKETHTSMSRRPKVKSRWMVANYRDRALHLLQGFGSSDRGGDGISILTAEKIFVYAGERIPLMWGLDGQQWTVKDLLQIPGVGKKRAQQLWAMLNPTERVEEEAG